MEGTENNTTHKLPLDVYYCKEFVEDDKTDSIKDSDDMITFVVGGTTFQSLRSNFAYWPTTRLSRLVRAKGRKQVLRFCNKISVCSKSGQLKYMFYRSGNNFNAILDKCYEYLHKIS